MMFRQLQKDATLRAAKLAGFQHCELLQEPIAASIAYGLSCKNADGYWLVFDFGGGTFDAALMSADEGIMKVVDTDGNSYLGGKNIDLAIVDEILFPYVEENYSIEKILSDKKGKKLLRAALKIHAEDIKKEIARGKPIEYVVDEPLGEDDNGEEIELDLRLTLDDVEKAVKPIFQKAIDISLELLKTNNITGKNLRKIILVGGPTLMQTIRNMLKEQIADKVDVSMDAMTCVAEGAAIFASTKDIHEGLQKRDRSKMQLKIKYSETTVELVELVGIAIETTKTEGTIPENIFIEITRSDNAWSSGKIEIENNSEVIEIKLNEGKSNGFNITLTDDKGNKLQCEPNNFTIIQGMKAAKAVLERNIAIAAIDTDTQKALVFELIGLKKNQSLPASGKTVLMTQKDLRPDNKEDKLRIPFYESEELNTRAILNEPIGEFVITGDMIKDFVPKNTEVQIKLELDASFKKVLTVFFEYTDQEIILDEPELKMLVRNKENINEQINKEYAALDLSNNDNGEISNGKRNELKTELKDQQVALDKSDSEDELIEAHEKIKKTCRKIDKLEKSGEWNKVEKELNEALDFINNLVDKSGDDNDKQVFNEIKQKAEQIITTKEVKLAKDLMQEIGNLQFNIFRKDIGYWIYFIKDFDEHFENHVWKNRIAARNLIKSGKENIMTAPNKEKLEQIVHQLFQLLPTKEESLMSKRDEELLRK